MYRRYGPRVLRTAAAAFFTVLAASGLATFGAARAHASPGAMDGVQDDAWLLYGPGTLEERLSTLDGLHALGIPALVTLYGSPRWANAHQAANRLPLNGFGDFAYAASKRFPWVRMWTAWNEPNSRTFAVPVSPSAYVRRVLNPAFASLHAASPANRVGVGVTSMRAPPSG